VESAGEGLGSEFTVLIVDDNADAAESLGMLLEMSGNEVTVAASGPEALQVMERRSPGIVILDIGLPGMDVTRLPKCCVRGRRANTCCSLH
jgi:CheY-like chemotaxis protein